MLKQPDHAPSAAGKSGTRSRKPSTQACSTESREREDLAAMEYHLSLALTRARRDEAEEDHVFALMPADMDERIDAITKRTDAIMVRTRQA